MAKPEVPTAPVPEPFQGDDLTPVPSPSSARAILLCQGQQARLWNLKQPKHLMPFNGRPLLSRTISMLRDQGINDIILNAEATDTWKHFAATNHVQRFAEPDQKPDQDYLDVLQHFRHLWNTKGPTLWIYGDVVFSHAMIGQLCKGRANDIFFVTRFSPSLGLARWRAEIFGWSMHPRFHAELDVFLRHRQCSPYHRATDIWNLFHFLMDRRDNNERDPDFIDAGEDDYTLDIDYEGDLADLPVLEMLAKEDRP
jgi:hypothetical protein